MLAKDTSFQEGHGGNAMWFGGSRTVAASSVIACREPVLFWSRPRYISHRRDLSSGAPSVCSHHCGVSHYHPSLSSVTCDRRLVHFFRTVSWLVPAWVHLNWEYHRPQVDGESCDGLNEFDHDPVIGGFTPEAPISGDKLCPVLADLHL